VSKFHHLYINKVSTEYHIKNNEIAIVEYLDYQIPVIHIVEYLDYQIPVTHHFWSWNCLFKNYKTRKNATVEYLDYQIPVT